MSQLFNISIANLGYTTLAVGSVTAIGFTLYHHWTDPEKKKRKNLEKRLKKIKPVKVPKWAISKIQSGQLEPKVMPPEDLDETLDARKPPELWNSAIFFPDPNSRSPDSPTQQLKLYFKEAKTSIYVCMYLCSLHEMSDLICEKYREGLIVQIVTDYETWTAHNNKGFKTLARKGIPVKLIVGHGCLMHNKFAIIDEEAALTGSLNWTKQGSMTNWENVMITTNPRLTKRYLKEFNKLWIESKDPEEVGLDNLKS